MTSSPMSCGTLRFKGLFFVFASLALIVVAPAKSGGVFDDSWAPPRKSAQTPVHASSRPSIPGPTAPQSRREIPGKLDQARSRDNLKVVFAAQMADASATARVRLARALLEAVPKTADNLSDQYVLLGGALNAAKEGGNLRLCVQAAETLSQNYEVDDLALVTDAALNMRLGSVAVTDTIDNVVVALGVLDRLTAEDDFASASKLGASLKALMPVGSYAPLVIQRTRDVEALRIEHDRAIAKLEVLKSAPDDPAANLAVGRYYCLDRGWWDKGLPYLAKGTDLDLKKAAGDELLGPQTPKDNELVGDAWWAAGEKQIETVRATVREHAKVFYRDALSSATGLARIKIEQRIGESVIAPVEGAKTTNATISTTAARSAEPHWVSLFNGKDLSGWSVESGSTNSFRVEDGSIVATGGDYKARNYLLTKDEYVDFVLRLEFQLDHGTASGVALRAFLKETVPEGNGEIADHPLLKLCDIGRTDPTGMTHWVTDDHSFAPKQTAPLRAVGSWNQLQIEVRGHAMAASVNGVVITRAAIVETARFPDGTVPALNRTSGRIGLLRQFGVIRYRNIEIQDFPRTSASTSK